MKKSCLKYKVWLEKQDKTKGNPLSYVYFESNLVNGQSNSWWLDSRATVHVIFILQGVTNKRSLKESERTLRVANNAEAKVTFIGNVSLHLESRFPLVLNNTFYVPSFRRNLISIPLLDKLGYCMNFGTFEVKLSLNSTNIGYGVLIDGLYKLSLVMNGEYILLTNKATSKRSRIQKRSSMLWLKHLGHILRECDPSYPKGPFFFSFYHYTKSVVIEKSLS